MARPSIEEILTKTVGSDLCSKSTAKFIASAVSREIYGEAEVDTEIDPSVKEIDGEWLVYVKRLKKWDDLREVRTEDVEVVIKKRDCRVVSVVENIELD